LRSSLSKIFVKKHTGYSLQKSRWWRVSYGRVRFRSPKTVGWLHSCSPAEVPVMAG
jgi:hypothetical protein